MVKTATPDGRSRANRSAGGEGEVLVAMVERLKGDAGRLAEDNARLARESRGCTRRSRRPNRHRGEMLALREERDLVRARVAEMLEQLEGLSL